MLDPSALDSEMNRLRQRLLSTEDALRNALEHNQQVDQLVQAMRQRPDRSPVTSTATRPVYFTAGPNPLDLVYPSGREPTDSVWEGEAKLGR